MNFIYFLNNRGEFKFFNKKNSKNIKVFNNNFPHFFLMKVSNKI